jgi:hypothetical protein
MLARVSDLESGGGTKFMRPTLVAKVPAHKKKKEDSIWEVV